jgi:hypothetical protein
MLYGRTQNVQFDALGIKQRPPVRIPLPKTLKVFQPLWAILASLGIVDDNELSVRYVPEAPYPSCAEGNTPADIENLLSCSMYDWNTSWEEVLAKRERRIDYESTLGMNVVFEDELPKSTDTQDDLIKQISATRTERSDYRKYLKDAQDPKITDVYLKDGILFRAGKQYRNPDVLDPVINGLFERAKNWKQRAIRPAPRFTHNATPAYDYAGDVIDIKSGSYGDWLHWDPRLWMEYTRVVEMVDQSAMFSLSMPNETTGTYTWLLPTVKHAESVFCKLPSKAIPPGVWLLTLICDMSLLPPDKHRNWYVETDRTSCRPIGMRKYIRAGIKAVTPVALRGQALV